MVTISEWLPNPVGNDASGEWVELVNDGDAAVNLAGWRLANAAGKSARLSGTIAPGERKVFHRSATKLTLRNEAEDVSLFTPTGILGDRSAFAGLAPEGKSVNDGGERDYLASPTPGTPNSVRQSASILQAAYPQGVALPTQAGSMWFALFGAAALLTLAGIIIMRAYDEKNTIPGGDQNFGG